MDWLKGFRTVGFGLATALLPAALQYIGGLDVTSLGLSPPVAAVLGSAIMALRYFTTTPIFKR